VDSGRIVWDFRVGGSLNDTIKIVVTEDGRNHEKLVRKTSENEKHVLFSTSKLILNINISFNI